MIDKKNTFPLLVFAAFAGLGCQAFSAQILVPATIHSVSSNLADSTGFDRTADHVVSGAGFTGQSHSINPEGTMWLNTGTFAAPNDLDPEITFDLGSVFSLNNIVVWNYNETLPDRPELLGRGVASANILVAGEDLVFSNLITDQAFDIAPGLDDADFGQVIDLTGASARYVQVDILGNHGGDANFVGLSEVQFHAVPEPSALLMLFGGLGLVLCHRRRKG